MIFRKILFLFSMPFALIYFILVSLRNVFYNLNFFMKHRLGAKVISVGNITWGGTGKTPLVAFIAELLTRKNYTVSILIRGYGNDESELLPKLTANLPVLVGRDRVRNGREVVDKHLADSIILDDGFQYRRLIRDLDIVCIDATNPFGNGWLIPAGCMREPRRSLKRADVFFITKVDLIPDRERIRKLEDWLRRLNPKAVIAKAIHRPLYFYRLSDRGRFETAPYNNAGGGRDRPLHEEKVNIDQLKNKGIVLVSAIGSPACFEKTILRLGLKINKHFIFRDHHLYAKDEVRQIEDYCKKHSLDTVITTEKDAVKLRNRSRAGFASHRGAGYPGARHRGETHPYSMDGVAPDRTRYVLQILVLKVRLEIIENEDGFYNRLFGIYSS